MTSQPAKATAHELFTHASASKVIDLFSDWLKQRGELKELMRFEADPGELERVARELNVTSADLEMLVRQGSRGANELSYTSRHWASTKQPCRVRSRPCCGTWSTSVRSVRTSAGAVRNSRPALLRRITSNIAKTRVPWTC